MAQPQLQIPAQAAQPNIYEQSAEQLGAPSFMDKLQMITGNPTNDARIRRLRELEFQQAQPSAVPGTVGAPIVDVGTGFEAYIQKLQQDFANLNTQYNTGNRVDAAVDAATAGGPAQTRPATGPTVDALQRIGQ